VEIGHFFKKHQESGIAPPINLSFIFIIGICIMFFLGFFYSALITLIPIIYFNIVILIGFSYTIAYTSYYLNIVFKIRDKTSSMIMTTVLALFATYFQWVFYLYIISSENVTPLNDVSYILDLLLNPTYLIEFIIELNGTGAWEIGDLNINGAELWIIWLGEILITLGISLRIYYNFNIKPFSEKDNQWYNKTKIDTDFEFINLKKTFLEEFYKNPVVALNSLKKGNGTRQSNVYIFSSKNQNSFLISIENSIVNKKGRKEYSEVLEPCSLNKNHLIGIKEKFTIR
jgi:hypothetical protein